MGVCCLVFDVDGMLFEFFMNFLDIEKKKNYNFFFQNFMFSSRFMLFPTLKKNKKIGVKKNSGGGGGWGGGVEFFGPGREILQRPPSVRLSVCPSVHPSVCLSVTFSFRTVTQKRIAVFSRNFADMCTKSWGCAV